MTGPVSQVTGVHGGPHSPYTDAVLERDDPWQVRLAPGLERALALLRLPPPPALLGVTRLDPTRPRGLVEDEDVECELVERVQSPRARTSARLLCRRGAVAIGEEKPDGGDDRLARAAVEVARAPVGVGIGVHVGVRGVLHRLEVAAAGERTEAADGRSGGLGDAGARLACTSSRSAMGSAKVPFGPRFSPDSTCGSAPIANCAPSASCLMRPVPVAFQPENRPPSVAFWRWPSSDQKPATRLVRRGRPVSLKTSVRRQVERILRLVSVDRPKGPASGSGQRRVGEEVGRGAYMGTPV